MTLITETKLEMWAIGYTYERKYTAIGTRFIEAATRKEAIGQFNKVSKTELVRGCDWDQDIDAVIPEPPILLPTEGDGS
jgi:hypothetical protein